MENAKAINLCINAGTVFAHHPQSANKHEEPLSQVSMVCAALSFEALVKLAIKNDNWLNRSFYRGTDPSALKTASGSDISTFLYTDLVENTSRQHERVCIYCGDTGHFQTPEFLDTRWVRRSGSSRMICQSRENVASWLPAPRNGWAFRDFQGHKPCSCEAPGFLSHILYLPDQFHQDKVIWCQQMCH